MVKILVNVSRDSFFKHHTTFYIKLFLTLKKCYHTNILQSCLYFHPSTSCGLTLFFSLSPPNGSFGLGAP